MITPSSNAIGEPQTFEEDRIKLTLTDTFIEKESELGFYAYYVSNFWGAAVLKEEFPPEDWLTDLSLDAYVGNPIANNVHTDVKPQNLRIYFSCGQQIIFLYRRTSPSTATKKHFMLQATSDYDIIALALFGGIPMLSKPQHGWTDFSLGAFSYLTQIPFDWLDRTILGMETRLLFEVYCIVNILLFLFLRFFYETSIL